MSDLKLCGINLWTSLTSSFNLRLLPSTPNRMATFLFFGNAHVSLASLSEDLPGTHVLHISTWLLHSQHLGLSLNISFRNVTLSVIFRHSSFMIPWPFSVCYIDCIYTGTVYHSVLEGKTHKRRGLTSLVHYSSLECLAYIRCSKLSVERKPFRQQRGESRELR